MACEKTLRDEFAHIDGERDNLLGVIENLKKESNSLLESKILMLQNNLTDSSRVHSDGRDLSCFSGLNVKYKTIFCFRASITSEGVRKGQPKGPVPQRVFTCS